jgi:hypothetical protein
MTFGAENSEVPSEPVAVAIIFGSGDTAWLSERLKVDSPSESVNTAYAL